MRRRDGLEVVCKVVECNCVVEGEAVVVLKGFFSATKSRVEFVEERRKKRGVKWCDTWRQGNCEDS